MTQSNQQSQALSGNPRGIIRLGSLVNCAIAQSFELNVQVGSHVSAVNTILARRTAA
ncbi:MAG: hypothetical protein R8K49_03340 [Mariprofundaceae bacterium]